ncbi:hypothetical protein [Chitinilyticum piscinae]|uniref:VCBS repeat-containing protein n=1 Tax=Chitinilyticum piscinae TaxID=2866724 RepID=A0A8J7FIL9_9NEIS|nr:hypothetical protein [Chitinilyticum piscinae]MBE9610098.1 hypothetical protein [Chitinilyticum piscinae]
MRITDSSVAMTAARQYQREQQESLTVRIERPRPPAPPREDVTLSPAGKQAVAASGAARDEEQLDPRMQLIKSLLEAMLGVEIRLAQPVDAQAAGASPAPAAAPDNEGGSEINYQYRFSEAETLQFAAAGVVRTADGQEISFSSELTLARSYQEESALRLATGSLARPKKDPLVLNYAGTAASLSNDTMRFDLDGDGQQERVATLNAGSAYLALDRNGDGRINDGRELFGTQSGDGFADLARFDDDGNGWIDAGDQTFTRLRVWLKDNKGQEQLLSLADLGIGALYLGRVKGDFSLTTATNTELGLVRSTGVFLRENGSSGTLQQIDLSV